MCLLYEAQTYCTSEFYRFANSIRSELSVIVRPLARECPRTELGVLEQWMEIVLQNDSGQPIVPADMRSEHPITPQGCLRS